MSVQLDIVEYEINLDLIDEEIVVNIVDGITVYDEGTKVANVRVLDFQGSGVTVTQSGNKVIITITGGGGPGGGWAVTGQTDLTGSVDILPTTDLGQYIQFGSLIKRIIAFITYGANAVLNATSTAGLQYYDQATGTVLKRFLFSSAGTAMDIGSDANGDLYYRAGGLLVRLPKGTAYQSLRMNSGATAPEWSDELSIETTEQTADFTFALTDAGKTVPVNSGTTKTGTVPANATVAFPVGTIIGVKWQTGAAGQPAVAAAGGVTINNTGGNLFVPAASVTAYLIKTATNTWTFSNGAPLNANLATIAGLVPAVDDVLQFKGTAWINRTIAQLRADLGASYVTICGATLNSGGNPADNTLYYFGQDVATIIASVADGRRVYVPLGGTIVSARVSFVNGGLSSGESSTISIRLNNTTDTQISAAVLNNATQTTFVKSDLAITVVQGDYFEFKWLTATWVTNPTGVSARWNVVIKVW